MSIEIECTTQELLVNHIDSLKEKLVLLEEDKSSLINAIEQAEKALSATYSKQKNTVYFKKSTFREKIMYCFNIRKKVLSIDDMVQILSRVDRDLDQDFLKTAQSIRVIIRKMLTEEIVVQYKLAKMKYTCYALKSWVDEIGEIKEKFLQ